MFQPTGCDVMKCKDEWALLFVLFKSFFRVFDNAVKVIRSVYRIIHDDGDWDEVQSASCNAGTFRGKLSNGKDFDADDKRAKVKCARESEYPISHRFYELAFFPECTRCQNPCPTCTDVKFTDAKKWNICTEFSVSVLWFEQI